MYATDDVYLMPFHVPVYALLYVFMFRYFCGTCIVLARQHD